MIREYRGRFNKNHSWVYGDGCFNNHDYGANSDIIKVHEQPSDESVEYVCDTQYTSQWTGLKDTDDEKIFEGDILRAIRTDGKCMYYKIWTQPGGFVMNCFQDDFYRRIEDIQFSSGISDMQTRSFIEGNCKVVGNIWDNPELMQKPS